MRIGNSGKSAPLILAALLLAGCAASTAASTPESAATPSPSAAPPATAETAQTTLTYDEIDYVIEGQLSIHCDGRTETAGPGEVLLIPKGSKIQFAVPDFARFLYVTYPADWQSSS